MFKVGPKVIDHGRNPRNHHPMPDASGVGEILVAAKEEFVRLYLRIDESQRIQEASFQIQGLSGAVPCTSALTELLPGLDLVAAQALTRDDISIHLDGLPEELAYGCMLALDTLAEAIADYRGEPSRIAQEAESPLICTCFQICEARIRRVIRDHDLETVKQVRSFTRACTGCHTCRPEIEKLLGEAQGG